VTGIPDARIRVVYLVAPDGHSQLELIEYLAPRSRPARRPVNEPGVAIVALGVRDSVGAVRRLREAGVEVLSDPVPYTLESGEETFTTYLYDPDGNCLCLFEVVPKGDA
jgi:hypothetical protein